MLTFGMPTLMEQDTLPPALSLCRELGLSFFELNMNFPQCGIEALEDTDTLLALQREFQVGYTIHLDERLDVCDFNHAVADAYLQTVLRAIAVAKVIHAPILNMHMNHGIQITLPDRKAALYEQYEDLYLEGFKRLRSCAEKAIGDADITICLENTDGFKNYEQKALDCLLESKVFGLTWDIGHSHAVGNTDEPILLSHENKLRHFHIHDAMAKQNHMTLGTGEIDLAGRLAIANRCNCRCVLETKTIAALKQSVLWLKQHGYQ